MLCLKMLFSLSPYMRQKFYNIHCENLVELQEVKLTKVWWPPMTWLHWSFKLTDLFMLSLQQSKNYSSDFPTPALVPVEVSAHESPLGKLWFFLCTSLSLQFDLTSRQIEEELLIFSVCSDLYLLGRIDDFLTCWSGNWKSGDCFLTRGKVYDLVELRLGFENGLR